MNQSFFNRQIVQHILFWIAILIYSTIFFGYPNSLLYYGKLSLTIMPIDMAFVYITIYYLLPKYLLKKKYIYFALFVLLLGYVDEIILRYITYEYFNPKNRAYTLETIFIGKGSFNVFTNYYIVLIAIALRLFRIWHRENELAKKNMQEKFDSEIRLKEIEHSMLKAQLHPHFLFNTLNNLYGLTLEKSDKSPEIVLKMSNLLSYMLYECNTKAVPLKKEIEQALNYISLEKLRYDDDLTINVDNSCNEANIPIAPLLILPFIENCFKHGTSEEVGLSWINMIFKYENDIFFMLIENSIYKPSEGQDDNANNGIGLKNVKQRLDALYPNKYDLVINETSNKFSVILNLNLCPQQ